eukprot:scaffold167_cov347-Prasinococcus_capsulatus_cf.AAC.2
MRWPRNFTCSMRWKQRRRCEHSFGVVRPLPPSRAPYLRVAAAEEAKAAAVDSHNVARAKAATERGVLQEVAARELAALEVAQAHLRAADDQLPCTAARVVATAPAATREGRAQAHLARPAPRSRSAAWPAPRRAGTRARAPRPPAASARPRRGSSCPGSTRPGTLRRRCCCCCCCCWRG